VNTPTHGGPRRGRIARGWLCAIAVNAVLVTLVVTIVAVYPLLPVNTRLWLYYRYIEPFGEGRGLDASGACQHASSRLEAGDFDGAIRWADVAIALRPNASGGYRVRGRAYDIRGDYDLAIADYSMAIRFGGGDHRTQLLRARAYERASDVDHAVADYRDVILAWSTPKPRLGELVAIRAGCLETDLPMPGAFLAKYPARCRDAVAELIALFDDAIKWYPDDEGLRTCRSQLISAKDELAAKADRPRRPSWLSHAGASRTGLHGTRTDNGKTGKVLAGFPSRRRRQVEH
jgi:tetratricopeptide (TPR) repeat protein